MITDFGLSKMEQNGIMSTACGTPGYVGEPRARADFLRKKKKNRKKKKKKSAHPGPCLEEGKEIPQYGDNNMGLTDALHRPYERV